jgi:hypothetical protein
MFLCKSLNVLVAPFVNSPMIPNRPSAVAYSNSGWITSGAELGGTKEPLRNAAISSWIPNEAAGSIVSFSRRVRRLE